MKDSLEITEFSNDLEEEQDIFTPPSNPAECSMEAAQQAAYTPHVHGEMDECGAHVRSSEPPAGEPVTGAG